MTTTHMSIAELKSNLISAIAKEHTATATLLYYLAEYEIRELHLRDGYSSLFKFLTEGHGYSEAAVARRCVAARFSRKYPEVLRMIASGDLSLSVIGLVAKAEIKGEMVSAVLTAVQRKSKTQAEMILLQYTGAVPAAPKKEKVKAVVVAVAKPQKSLLDDCQDSTIAPPSKAANVFLSTDDNQVAEENHQASANQSAVAFQVSLCLSETSMQKLKRASRYYGSRLDH